MGAAADRALDRALDRGYLLLRRAGVLWGVEHGAVEGLRRQGELYRISLGGLSGGELRRTLAADEILCVVNGLRVRPLAPAMRRFWPETCAGLAGVAMHGEQPLLVVDPRRPPDLLRLDDGTEEEGEPRRDADGRE